MGPVESAKGTPFSYEIEFELPKGVRLYRAPYREALRAIDGDIRVFTV